MTRPTEQQIEAARRSDLGVTLVADFDVVLAFVGHNETYGEFVVWLDCAGEELKFRGTTFLEGAPRESSEAVPGIVREFAALFTGDAA